MSEQIGNVWVFIEQEGGKIADVSLELVSKGTELAAKLGVDVEAVLLGSNVESCCATLFQYGCKTVYLADDPRLEPFTVLPFARVIMDLIREHKPNILLFGATMKGRELAPRIASEKLAGLTADCTDLRIDDFDDKVNKKFYKNKLMQIRPAFGGNIIATIVNTWDDPQMVTVREGVMKMAEPNPAATGTIVRVNVALTEEETVVKVIERIRQEKTVNLKGAQIIVAGGYGVGSKENFQLIRELAQVLGGEVGAPRGGRRRLDRSRSPGRTDRGDGSPETLHRLRHQRFRSALCRDERKQKDHCDQYGSGRADFLGRPLRNRRGSQPGHPDDDQSV